MNYLKKNITFNLTMLFVLIFLLFTIAGDFKEMRDTVYPDGLTSDIKKGNTYLYIWNQKEGDPFRKIRIDTVRVIGVKDGYVKWLYNYEETDSTYYLSGKLNRFKKKIKPYIE
tara:strand:- start:5677 stop:6015 length:339 start_codon:yes stop_codon:yes gene_type:complete